MNVIEQSISQSCRASGEILSSNRKSHTAMAGRVIRSPGAPLRPVKKERYLTMFDALTSKSAKMHMVKY